MFFLSLALWALALRACRGGGVGDFEAVFSTEAGGAVAGGLDFSVEECLNLLPGACDSLVTGETSLPSGETFFGGDVPILALF